MMTKAIITVAPTGEGPKKSDNPAVPVTPREIAEDVFEAYQAGAAVAHLHMRDDEQNPSMSTEKFAETVALIREKCDIILNLTTSGDVTAGDDIRLAHLRLLKPEMASFDCGSMNWMNETLFINHPAFLDTLGRTMLEYGIKPEIEIFDTGMVSNSLFYLKKGVLKAPVHYQFVMGAPGGIPSSIENLIYLVRQIPEGSTWSAFGIGRHHLSILSAALALGGHVRIGFEDNIYYHKGVLAKSNSELVRRGVRMANELDRGVASVAEAREILGLAPAN